MKKYVDGKFVDMTEAEVAEFEKQRMPMEEPQPTPTVEDLWEMLQILGG